MSLTYSFLSEANVFSCDCSNFALHFCLGKPFHIGCSHGDLELEYTYNWIWFEIKSMYRKQSAETPKFIQIAIIWLSVAKETIYQRKISHCKSTKHCVDRKCQNS